jgi:hypothetical protein
MDPLIILPKQQSIKNETSTENRSESKIEANQIKDDQFEIKTKQSKLNKFIIFVSPCLVDAFEATHKPIDILLEKLAAQIQQAKFGVIFFEGFSTLIEIPLMAHSIYSLLKNWRIISPTEKALEAGSILHSKVAIIGGVAALMEEIPLVPHVAEAIAAKKSTVLGPIGLWMGAGLMAVRGTKAAWKAHQLDKQIKAIKRLEETVKNSDELKTNANKSTEFILKLFERENVRFSNHRKFEMIASAKAFLITLGLTAGAIGATLVTAGVITALAATPFGWVVLGTLTAGAIIGLGVYAYRKSQAKKKAKIEQEGFAKELLDQMKADPTSSYKTAEKRIKELEEIRKQVTSGPSLIDQKKLAELITDSLLGDHGPIKSDNSDESKHLDLLKAHLKSLGLKLNLDKEQDQKDLLNSEKLKKLIETELSIHLLKPNRLKLHTTTHQANQLIKKVIEYNLMRTTQAFLFEQLKEVKENGPLTKEYLSTIMGSSGSDLSMEHIHHYAAQVASSATWPGNRSLVSNMRIILKTQTQTQE